MILPWRGGVLFLIYENIYVYALDNLWFFKTFWSILKNVEIAIDYEIESRKNYFNVESL